MPSPLPVKQTHPVEDDVHTQPAPKKSKAAGNRGRPAKAPEPALQDLQAQLEELQVDRIQVMESQRQAVRLNVTLTRSNASMEERLRTLTDAVAHAEAELLQARSAEEQSARKLEKAAADYTMLNDHMALARASIVAFKNDIVRVAESKVAVEGEKDAVTARCDKLQIKSDELQRERDAIRSRLELAAHELERLRPQRHDLQVKFDSVSLDRDAIQTNLEQLTQESARLTKDKEKLQHDVETLSHDRDEIELLLQHSIENCSRFETEREDLQVDFNASTQQLSDLQLRIQRIETDKANVETELANSSQQHIVIQCQRDGLLNENADLKTRLETGLQERTIAQSYIERVTNGFEQASAASQLALRSTVHTPRTHGPRIEIAPVAQSLNESAAISTENEQLRAGLEVSVRRGNELQARLHHLEEASARCWGENAQLRGQLAPVALQIRRLQAEVVSWRDRCATYEDAQAGLRQTTERTG
jgi:chromosome segregation ATPase